MTRDLSGMDGDHGGERERGTKTREREMGTFFDFWQFHN